MKLKNKIIILLIISILFIALIFSTIFSILNMSKSTILDGITINNIDVSGMSKEDAISKLIKIAENKLNNGIEITFADMDYTTNINLSTLDMSYDINTAVNEAYSIGRIGNIFENNYTILNTLLNKKNIEINMNLNEEKLSQIIKNISSDLPDKFVQNNYYIENEDLIITRGTSGNTLDENNFVDSLTNYLTDFSFETTVINSNIQFTEIDAINIEQIHSEIYKEPQDAYYEENPFKVYNDIQGIDFDIDSAKTILSDNPNQTEYTIPLTYTNANVSLNDLDIDIFQDLLGSYSTKYNDRNKDRTTNLNLAAEKISGKILAPGETFSYNTIVGERSIAAGYKEAKIYSNGQVIEGLGGGICQISSTLYNAVVLANLNVTERYNHQFVTSYVPAGRDATVAYGSKDLKFVNNRSYPIKIVVTVNSGIAKVEIYGIKEDNEYNIDFDVETVSTIEYSTEYKNDSSLAEGTETVEQTGANGAVVKTYKVLKQNGIEVSRDLLSQDTYNALNEVIIKGTKSDE